MAGKNQGAFESYDRPPDEMKSSDRSFGLVMAVAFAVIGGFQLYHHRMTIGAVLLVVAAAFAAAALVRPGILHPLNRLWFRLGLLLHKVINPVVMAVIFVGAVVPTGLIMRALGKRPLQLSLDRSAETYWIQRTPPGPAPDSLERQF